MNRRIALGAALALLVGYGIGRLDPSGPTAVAEEERRTAPRAGAAYYPNTEELAADEMRITALGTGLPTPLTRAQKSTSWLVELGNGDAFLFDIGTGSMETVFGLRPDFSKLDKVFLSHLHTRPLRRPGRASSSGAG